MVACLRADRLRDRRRRNGAFTFSFAVRSVNGGYRHARTRCDAHSCTPRCANPHGYSAPAHLPYAASPRGATHNAHGTAGAPASSRHTLPTFTTLHCHRPPHSLPRFRTVGTSLHRLAASHITSSLVRELFAGISFICSARCLQVAAFGTTFPTMRNGRLERRALGTATLQRIRARRTWGWTRALHSYADNFAGRYVGHMRFPAREQRHRTVRKGLPRHLPHFHSATTPARTALAQAAGACAPLHHSRTGRPYGCRCAYQLSASCGMRRPGRQGWRDRSLLKPNT